MAQPAPRVAAPEDPPVDPEAIDRAYHYHRARRNAKLRRKRESAHARLRFVLTVSVLAALAIFLMLTIWHEVQSVFGL
jgi:Trk-type K+ transport system membrane component